MFAASHISQSGARGERAASQGRRVSMAISISFARSCNVMMNNFDTKRFDQLIEKISVIAIVLVALAVMAGFVRLVLEHWSYIILLLVVIGAATYMIKKSNFRF